MYTKLHRLMMASAALGMGSVMFTGAGTALAAPESDAVIQYGDLDTSTPSGVQALSDRVRQVAWNYCLTEAPPESGPSRLENVRCQQAVIDEAVAKINNPLLTQMFPDLRADETWRSG